MKQLIECVPNFSEGRDMAIIKQITDVVEQTEGVQLLNVDPGKATNRTVVTFAGPPEAVIEAAFLCIQKAAELIDMRRHRGEHPRMGATDVCPLVPISGITMEETAAYARRLAERVGRELHIPTYLYEAAAASPERKNLADIRAGEYEGLPEKIKRPEWKPDFGPAEFNARSGATVIGARDFLIAYNVNLNTTSVRRANSVAFDIREKGRILNDPATGKPLKDADGEPLRQPGLLKGVKAIGWYIEEYGIAQISINITDIHAAPIYTVFEACHTSADKRGMRVTGSELVGLIPLQSLLEAGRYFLRKQQRSLGVSEAELIKIAVKSLGLDDLAPFNPREKIIEYRLAAGAPTTNPLLQKTLAEFAEETASESPAPGGGSVSAYVGALGVSLATMVANLSSHKRGWDERWETFSEAAEEGQRLKNALLLAVDEDTAAFNEVMAAFGLPNATPEEKSARKQAIQAATKVATEVPLRVMETALSAFGLIRRMAETGNPNSVTDAGVGALCVKTAVYGAFLNVKVNAGSLDDKDYAQSVVRRGEQMLQEAAEKEQAVWEWVNSQLKN